MKLNPSSVRIHIEPDVTPTQVLIRGPRRDERRERGKAVFWRAITGEPVQIGGDDLAAIVSADRHGNRCLQSGINDWRRHIRTVGVRWE